MHIPEDHPAMPGHFPGHPLIPAVVIMDQVVVAFEAQFKTKLDVFSFPQIKFLVPMFPNNEFEIAFKEIKPGRIDFTVANDELIYTKGKLSFEV